MAKLLGGFLLLTAMAFVVVGLFLPTDFEIIRSKSISAHPLRVIEHISQLDRWNEWWPWNHANSGGELVVEEQKTNLGASLSWNGRPAAGRLVLTKLSVYSIEYDIFFKANTRPDKGVFEIRNSGNATELVWRVNAHYEIPILGGYLARFADAMHGGTLSWGLSNLKKLAEEDTSEMNIYYEDEQGNEVVETIN